MSSFKNFFVMSFLVLTALITRSAKDLRETANHAQPDASLTSPDEGNEGSGATCT